MLPDFPQVKRPLVAALEGRMRHSLASASGPFLGAKEGIIHEGASARIIREDGTVDDIIPQKIETSFSVPNSKTEDLSPDEVRRLVDGAAEELGRQKAKLFYEKVDQVTEEAGQVVRAGGEQSIAEAFLEMLSKMVLPFDAFGNLDIGQIVLVCHPDTAPTLAEAQAEIQRNPELKRRHDAILAERKEHWRAEETRRRLVG